VEVTVDFDLDAYLERVGLRAAPAPGEEGLRALHRAQFFGIPFENLDIHLGRGIDLAPAAVFAKLVTGRRGGYCFELNGLLDRALAACGFPTRPLLARVHLGGEPSARTHLLCLVTLDGREWIADAGFGGGGPRRPLPLEEGAAFDDGVQACRLTRVEPWGWVLQTRDKGEWRDSYSFDRGVATPRDIQLGNWFTSTSPDTHFTRVRTVSRPTATGRIGLRDREWTAVVDGREESRTVEPAEYMSLLADRFGIDPGAGFGDFAAPCPPA
jgi:N-hydroxyarylamine O-acetyltransferase